MQSKNLIAQGALDSQRSIRQMDFDYMPNGMNMMSGGSGAVLVGNH